jgi:hypothetical protein
VVQLAALTASASYYGAGTCPLRSGRWAWWRLAGGVFLHGDVSGRPGVHDGVDDGPCLLSFVAADEQGRVGVEHFEDQVGVGGEPRRPSAPLVVVSRLYARGR